MSQLHNARCYNCLEKNHFARECPNKSVARHDSTGKLVIGYAGQRGVITPSAEIVSKEYKEVADARTKQLAEIKSIKETVTKSSPHVDGPSARVPQKPNSASVRWVSSDFRRSEDHRYTSSNGRTSNGRPRHHRPRCDRRRPYDDYSQRHHPDTASDGRRRSRSRTPPFRNRYSNYRSSSETHHHETRQHHPSSRKGEFQGSFVTERREHDEYDPCARTFSPPRRQASPPRIQTHWHQPSQPVMVGHDHNHWQYYQQTYQQPPPLPSHSSPVVIFNNANPQLQPGVDSYQQPYSQNIYPYPPAPTNNGYQTNAGPTAFSAQPPAYQ